MVPPVTAGRADPDFTKKLKWQPVQNLTAKAMGDQVWTVECGLRLKVIAVLACFTHTPCWRRGCDT